MCNLVESPCFFPLKPSAISQPFLLMYHNFTEVASTAFCAISTGKEAKGPIFTSKAFENAVASHFRGESKGVIEMCEALSNSIVKIYDPVVVSRSP